MNTSDFDKILFVKECINSSIQSVIYLNGTLTLFYEIQKVEQIKEDLTKRNIPFESFASNEITIVLNKFSNDIKVFFDEVDYCQKIQLFVNLKEDTLEHPSTAILNFKNSLLLFDNGTKNILLNNNIYQTFFFENTIWYFNTLKVFKSERFADYVNTLKDQIIIYTGTKGIKQISFTNILPTFDSNYSIRSTCEKLINRVNSSQDFIIHFKNHLFNIKIDEELLSVKRIIESLPQILKEAENSLELYLKNFSFDKLKSDLQKEKDKYFATLREILGKIIGQIFATPISFAASVFATYKVDSVITLIIILASFLIYTLFTLYIQNIYLKDVKEVEIDFNTNFTLIAENSGLSTASIEEEGKKVARRIIDIKNIIIYFRFLLVILFLVFAYFIYSQLSSSNTKEKESIINNYYFKSDTTKLIIKN